MRHGAFLRVQRLNLWSGSGIGFRLLGDGGVTMAQNPIPRGLAVDDAWFDFAPRMEHTVLRFAVAVERQVPAEFWSRFGGPNGPWVCFRRVFVSRGQQVFEATEWHSGSEPASASSFGPRLLTGPFQPEPPEAVPSGAEFKDILAELRAIRLMLARTMAIHIAISRPVSKDGREKIIRELMGLDDGEAG